MPKFYLDEVIEECIKNLEHEAGKKQLHIHVANYDNTVPIHGDRTRIKQVLINILSNSIKHSYEKGLISLQVIIRNSFNIIIKDNGCGISEDQIKHLFKPYYQVDPNSKHAGSAGLGLHISKKIVEAHQGKMTLQSREGRGTVVFITLPTQLQDEQIHSEVIKKPQIA